jgi:hypothetical protein
MVPACLKILPYLFPSNYIVQEWIKAYHYHPAVCYALKYAVAVHRDLMQGCHYESQRPEIIADKYHTSVHLSRMLRSNRSRYLTEIALLVVCILANNQIGEDTMSDGFAEQSLAMIPPFPPPHPLRVYGMLSRVETHARIAVVMVGRLGGLKALRLPGLAEKLA